MARRTEEQIKADYYKERRSILNRRYYLHKKYGIELTDVKLPQIPEKITAKAQTQLTKARKQLEQTTIQRSIEKGITSKSKDKFIPEFKSVALYRLKEDILKHIKELGAIKIYKWLTYVLTQYSEEEVAQVLAQAQQDGIVASVQTYTYNAQAEEFIRDVTPYFEQFGEMQYDELQDALDEVTYVGVDDSLVQEFVSNVK